MKRLIYVVLMLLLTRGYASEVEISAFNQGVMTWINPNENGFYRVEWATSLNQEAWKADWAGLQHINATGEVMSVAIPLFYRVVFQPRQTNDMMIVPGGGQPGGPSYTFYMSKYETRCEEYADFLNDAQAYPNTARGSNVFINASGDAYFTPTFEANSLLFRLSDSRLFYNPSLPIGARYSVYPDYIGHPISGVSLYGAIKYCNWLTLHTGMTISDLCYSEGPSPTDWIPAHLSWDEWNDGFSDYERQQWVDNFRGYRLPMDNESSTANYYNEFYKAGAWTGSENTIYGYGRNAIGPQDANYLNSGDPFEELTFKSTPVGFYDGSIQLAGFHTASNYNQYGLFDITGNVQEIMADRYFSAWDTAVVRGGHWNQSSIHGYLHLTYRAEIQKTTTGRSIGFRVVSTGF